VAIDRRSEQLEHVVLQLFTAVESLRAFYERQAADVDLTPPQARILLLAARGCSQRELAAEFRCDASNIVGIVDRLEQRGLVMRRPSPSDRRVKLVSLTEAGRQVRDRFQDALRLSVPVLADLDPDELDRLERVLDRFAPPAC
jgi:DNA-binding MarR family transcriptional regulator